MDDSDVRASALTRLVHALARLIGGLWASVSVVTGVGILIGSAAITGFVVLADEVLEGETEAIDAAILGWVAGPRSEWMDLIALQVTALGNVATLLVVVLTATSILWAARRKVSVALLIASVFSGIAANFLLKVAFGRPRPEVEATLAETLTASFPSGHAMSAAITYGTVAFLVGRMATGAVRWLTWAGAAGLIVLIGLSRLYLGVHYPSDVLAGWLGGIGWTALLILIFHMLGILVEDVPGLGEAEPELKREGVAEAVPPR